MNPRTTKLIKTFLGHIGLSVRPAKNVWPVDLTNASDVDPVVASYLHAGRPVLLKVPISDCLHLNWLAFKGGKDSKSPFVLALKDYATDSNTVYEQSFLKVFYEAYQPKNGAELIGL